MLLFNVNIQAESPLSPFQICIKCNVSSLDQWYSTGGMRRHLRGYV